MTHADCVDILKDLIRIDSRLTQSNMPILRRIEDLVGRAGTWQRFSRTIATETGDKEIEIANLVVEFPDAAGSMERPLILAGHTDTVEANPLWPTDPFEPIVEGDRLIGLGAGDMLSGVAAIVAIAQELQESGQSPRRPLVCIFTADEEGDVAGAQYLIGHTKFSEADIILPEPTDLKISLGQKATLDFRIRTQGKAGHASRAYHNDRDSALYQMHRIMTALIQDEEKRLKRFIHPEFGPGVQNLGYLRSGVGFNVIPEEAYLEGTRRLTPEQNFDEEKGVLRKLVAEAAPSAKLQFFFEGPAFITARNHRFVKDVAKAARSVLKKVDYSVQKGWTEGGLYQAWGNVIVFGPGDTLQSHTAGESVSIKAVRQYVDVLRKLVL